MNNIICLKNHWTKHRLVYIHFDAFSMLIPNVEMKVKRFEYFMTNFRCWLRNRMQKLWWNMKAVSSAGCTRMLTQWWNQREASGAFAYPHDFVLVLFQTFLYPNQIWLPRKKSILLLKVVWTIWESWLPSRTMAASASKLRMLVQEGGQVTKSWKLRWCQFLLQNPHFYIL